MASKWKKKLKKVAKVAAPVIGALALAKGLGKRRLSKAVSGTDDASLGVSHFKDYITKKAKPNIPGDYLTTPTWAAKGGRIGANKGGLIKGKPKLAKKGWK